MTPDKSYKTGPRRAFTLLELVVALAMVAVLSVSLAASIRIAFRAQSSAEAAVTPSRSIDLALEFIRMDFENALPQGDNLAGAMTGVTTTDALGNPAEEVELYTTAPSPLRPSGNGEIKLVRLLVTPLESTGEYALVRQVTRNLLSPYELTPDEQVVCRNVKYFDVRYFDGSDWQDDWDTASMNSLPMAVEVTLEVELPVSGTLPFGQSAPTARAVRVFKVPCSTLTVTGLGSGGGQ